MANFYNQYGYQNYTPYQQPVQQQIQNGGIVNVQSEQEARDYLVAQGTSVFFVNGPEQKLYIKTRGYSPLEQPTFEVFKRVDEHKAEPSNFVNRDEFDALKSEIAKIKEGIANEQSNS